MRKILATGLFGLGLALGPSGVSAQQAIELHGASQFNDDHAFTKALAKFGELVKACYGKPLNIILHKNSELGLEKQYFEYMSQGTRGRLRDRLAGAYVDLLQGGSVHRCAVPVPRPRALE